MNPGVELIDGWKRAGENPATFFVPSTQDLMKLAPGDHVKLGVEWHGPAPHGERFWVKLLDLTQPLTGIVEQSDMLLTARHGVAHGDTIFFEPCHILSIYDGK